MDRLCERPGCSEPASVAYGMRPEDLIFWLDVLQSGTDANDAGALCRRHADSMVVPRNWTLDDLRDPDLHLFRPPAEGGAATRRSRRARVGDDDAEQLALGVDDAASAADAAAGDDAGAAAAGSPTEAVNGDEVEAWSPVFDSDDDLDGLLSARSPLLARAFRGDDRRPPR
ncbi:MAG: hypothetical protein HKN44_01525 [Ilumatobacter sp.]|nr:hypothetical protein [Ilumatobacter sp.]